MKSNLPSFTCLIFSLLASQTPVPAMQAAAQAPAERRLSVGDNAQQVVIEAQAMLLEQPTLEAKIRQQVNLFGYKLIGSGNYQQQGQGRELLARLELKLQVAGQVSSMLQVSDGRWLWSDQQLPSGQNISRIDLDRVRDAWEEGGAVPPALPRFGLSVGGLPELLAGLNANFDFVLLQEDRLSGLAVYVLRGTWKPESLQAALGLKAEDKPDLDQLPGHLPHEVLVMLGRDDLFPYTIDYRRHKEPEPGQEKRAGQGTSLVRMQLFEVRSGGMIDARQFVYKPNGKMVTDQTDQFIELCQARKTLATPAHTK